MPLMPIFKIYHKIKKKFYFKFFVCLQIWTLHSFALNITLIYIHNTQVVLLRCGQPLTSIGSKRSREDEKLVNATLGGDSKGIIIDTRSQAAAMNSRSKGTS